MGCVGKDRYADIMEGKSHEIGLNVIYQKSDEHLTGRCAALITGNHRYYFTTNYKLLNFNFINLYLT